MKKILKILVIIFFIIPFHINAKGNYAIEEINTNITVKKDYYEYENKIDAKFYSSDSKFEFILPNKIENIKTNNNYYINNDVLTISNSNKFKKTIELSYDYKTDNRDEDIFNINIKNTYGSDANKINFSIELPEKVNISNIKFLVNNEKIRNSNLTYKINGKKVTGTYKHYAENDTITMKVDYTQHFNGLLVSSIILPIVLTFISYILWYIYGKDLKMKINKSSKLPTNMNPIDIAIVHKDKIDNEDILAMIIYLANKGYIEINDEEDILKIKYKKKYDGKNYKESIFINELFKINDKLTITEYINAISENKKMKSKEYYKELTGENLDNKLKKIKRNFLNSFDYSEEKDKYYEKNTENKQKILIGFIATILIYITSIPFIELNKINLLPISLVLSVISLMVINHTINKINILNYKKRDLILSAILIIVLMIILFPILNREYIYTISYIINLISVIIILLLNKLMPKRTIYGTKLEEKVLSFINFIDTYEKSNIDKILELNKEYLFDILAFAYEFKKEDKILNEIEKRKLFKIKWYKKEKCSSASLNESIRRIFEMINNKEEE